MRCCRDSHISYKNTSLLKYETQKSKSKVVGIVWYKRMAMSYVATIRLVRRHGRCCSHVSNSIHLLPNSQY